MPNKLFVGNLPYSTTAESLKTCFAACGTVLSATVVTDRFSGRSRGFGFVEMSTEAEVQEAITSLNGKLLMGRSIKVNAANPSPARTGASRGGSPWATQSPQPFRAGR